MSRLGQLTLGSVVPDITWRKQDWAYEQVREWIISGELVPGESIDQEQLASVLGISRIPLREGLARLIAEGLLSGLPHRQLSVSELSAADARDVYCSRHALETTLATAAAARAGIADFAGVQRLLTSQRELVAAGSSGDFRRLDRQFHFGIYELADMPKTMGAASSMYSMGERYVRLYLADPQRSATSFNEHEAIFNAVKAGDSAEAGRLTGEHVAKGLTLVEARFSSIDPPAF